MVLKRLLLKFGDQKVMSVIYHGRVLIEEILYKNSIIMIMKYTFNNELGKTYIAKILQILLLVLRLMVKMAQELCTYSMEEGVVVFSQHQRR